MQMSPVNETRDRSNTLQKKKMFYVRHGEDQTTMFNSKCQTLVLLNFIKKTLAMPLDATIDFVPLTADPKLINPIGVAEKGDTMYANTFLPLRSHWVLIQSKEDEDGAKEWSVLWKSKQDERDKLVAALEARNAEEKKKIAASKGKGGKK